MKSKALLLSEAESQSTQLHRVGRGLPRTEPHTAVHKCFVRAHGRVCMPKDCMEIDERDLKGDPSDPSVVTPWRGRTADNQVNAAWPL